MIRWSVWSSLAIVLSWSGSALAADPRIDVTVASSWDWLVVDFDCRDLFDADAKEALESGLPARLNIGVEVWQDRSTLWDRHVDTVVLTYRILFDVLEERYEVYDEIGEFVTASDTLATIERFVASEREFELMDLAELDPGSHYFVSVVAELQPLSVREIRDLERWLRGNIGREREGRGFGGISDHLFGILKNQVGMGSRRGEARSDPFQPSKLARARDD